MKAHLLFSSLIWRGLRLECAQCLGLLRFPALTAFLLVAVSSAVVETIPRSTAQVVQAGAGTNATSPGSSADGKLVFSSQGCDKCHGSKGEGLSAASANEGTTRIASTTLTLPAFIQLIRKPKGKMPPYDSQDVSDTELADVFAYLHSAPVAALPHDVPVAGNTHSGQQLFTKYGCYECHLSQGQGSRATGTRLGPPQLPLSAFISYVRVPTGDMPPYTEKTVSNQELTDMYAFLQSVPQPRPWKSIPLLNQ